MGPYDDPLAAHSIEELRRSIALSNDQRPTIERHRALALLDELARLEHEHHVTVALLRGLLMRLERPGPDGGDVKAEEH